jgi:hypothetical protein
LTHKPDNLNEIATINSLIFQEKLKISNRCELLNVDMNNYAYSVKNGLPEKGIYDHDPDAMRGGVIRLAKQGLRKRIDYDAL